jgi:nucleoside transporter
MTNTTAVGARLSLMMFLQFFVWGAWYVSVGVYMKKHGLGDSIAWAYTVAPIAAVVSPIFLGMIADRFFPSQRVLGVMHLLGGLAMLAVPWAAGQSQSVFIGVLLLHTLCYMPTLALSNAVAFRNLQSQEKQFPLVRVFGTLGWIAANQLVSAGFNADDKPLQFQVAAAAAILLGIYSFTLPHTPAPAAGKPAKVRDIFGLDALALLKDRSFAVFIVSSFLICIPLAAYYAFAPVFAESAGFKNTAAWMSLGQMSEVVFMIAMPLFFVRLGVKWMLLAGMLGWVLRYGLFAGAASQDSGADLTRAMVIAGILLHGICYDFFFVAGSIYTDRKAGHETRAQAQALLIIVTQGLGLGIGAQIMGRVVKGFTSGEAPAQTTDWVSVWLVPCIAAAVIAVIFWALFRDIRTPDDIPNGEASEEARR